MRKIKFLTISLLSFFASNAIADPINADDVELLKWVNSNIFGCDVKHGEITSRVIFAARVSDNLTLRGEQIETININGNIYRKNSEFSGNAGRNTRSLTMYFENYHVTSYDPIPDYNWGEDYQIQVWPQKTANGFEIQGQVIAPNGSRTNLDYCEPYKG